MFIMCCKQELHPTDFTFNLYTNILSMLLIKLAVHISTAIWKLINVYFINLSHYYEDMVLHSEQLVMQLPNMTVILLKQMHIAKGK